MRKPKDLSVTVISSDEPDRDHNHELNAVLRHLEGHVREVSRFTPDDTALDTSSSDVVHAFGWAAGVAASTHRSETPVLVSPPAFSTGDGLPHDDAELDSLVRADGVLVSSSRHREEVHNLGIPWYRLTTVPPTVDVDVYTRRGAAAARTDRHRLVAEVDADGDEAGTIFHAMRLVESTELILFADAGPDTDLLRSRAGAEGVGGRTAVVSPSEPGERAWWLRSSDAAVVVPSQTRDSSLALQAMACGSAVVATSVDELEDVVVHGVTGLHVPVGDPVSLARALRTVLADAFSIESLGMAASDRALNRFSPERVARDLASAYARSAGDVAAAEEEPDPVESVATGV
jgi:D-inositol-3-phosphate glycosyltransferase